MTGAYQAVCVCVTGAYQAVCMTGAYQAVCVYDGCLPSCVCV